MRKDEPVGILLVDDIVANLDALEAAVESPAYRLVRANSGQEALRILLNDEFAVIVLDVMMPTMDGFETARLIKSRERSAHIPIIFLTAVAMDQRFRDLGYGSGAVDYLVKPVDEIALRAKLAVFADLYRMKEALRRKTAEVLQLRAETADVEDEHRRQVEREKGAFGSFSAKEDRIAITARLYGDRPLRESAPELHEDISARYQMLLSRAVDASLFEGAYSVSDELMDLAQSLCFVGAGPRDVIDIHKQALAQSSMDKAISKKRAIAEEGRYLLVELMGDVAGVYRSKFRNRSGLPAKEEQQKTSA